MTMPEQGLAQPAPADTFSPQLTPSQLNVGQLPGYQSRGESPHSGGPVSAPRVTNERSERPERIERAQLPADSLLEPSRAAVPALGMDGFSDSNFGQPNWFDGPLDTMVDHPLLRGLLLELPPRGTQPSPEWMNRWFEAARSVLDLIYLRR
jgi:hypothetical protein